MLVDRRNPDRTGILRRAARLMDDGLSLIVFPEGTRSVDGTVGRFKGGSFMLALEAGLPIVPISVDRTRFVMRKGRLETRPGNVTLTIHDPIPVTAHPRNDKLIHDAKTLAAKVREVISTSVSADGREPLRAAS
jgi:1-acyl-sn-glycerol-3-phosphate acyltransferase